MAENAENTFEPYLLLPLKNRLKIIDQMKPDDRCRFVRCSKSSSVEAKASKNYIYKLKLEVLSRDNAQISITYGKHASFYGFHITFARRFGEYKVCSDILGEELWAEQLNNSPDLFHCALQEFKNRLHQCQNVVRKLSIVEHSSFWDPKFLADVDFEIDNLNNLENLTLLAEIEFQQIFSKLHRPLKTLFFGVTESTENIVEYPQLYQVQDKIVLWFGQLRKDNFARLAAKSVTMPIGNLTEYDIFQFIRAWQNGSIDREIETYRWNLGSPNFNVQNLMRLLRVRDPEGDEIDGDVEIEIKHFNEAGKYAILSCSEKRVKFSTEIFEVIF